MMLEFEIGMVAVSSGTRRANSPTANILMKSALIGGSETSGPRVRNRPEAEREIRIPWIKPQILLHAVAARVASGGRWTSNTHLGEAVHPETQKLLLAT
jgi:hypothetical protein